MPAPSYGLFMPEIFDEEKIVFEGGERLEVAGEFVRLAIAGRGPKLGAHTVGHEHERHAHRRLGELQRGTSRGSLGHDFEPGKGHGGSSATQKGPAGKRFEHGFSLRYHWERNDFLAGKVTAQVTDQPPGTP